MVNKPKQSKSTKEAFKSGKPTRKPKEPKYDDRDMEEAIEKFFRGFGKLK